VKELPVLITEDADQDLEDIHDYIAKHDGPVRAAHVHDQIEAAVISLSHSPERGVIPGELQAMGTREFREIFFKPYRIFYQATEEKVYILLIADGRRDMRTLLQRRLLEA